MILTHTKNRRERSLTPFDSKWGARINMGLRSRKKVEQNGETTTHEGYIYRGYLQIACVNLQKPYQAAERYITWDPTQPTATRPLALQQNSVWYTYGWDLIRLRVSLRSLATPRQAKNICELYNNTGYILNLYTYTPYGTVTAAGEVDQPLQWSSEMHDTELALVYYKTADGCKAGWTCVDRHAPEGRGAERRLRVNYRYYNPTDGRWTRRDPIGIEGGMNLFQYCDNSTIRGIDIAGLDTVNNPTVIDSFGRSCCQSEISYVFKIVFKAFQTSDHLVGHAAISCPGIGTCGKYPKRGCSFLRIFGRAEIRDDSWMVKPEVKKYLVVTPYRACPESLRIIQSRIKQGSSVYSLACAQCENWVDDIISGAGLPCSARRLPPIYPAISPPGYSPPIPPEALKTPSGYTSIPVLGIGFSF